MAEFLHERRDFAQLLAVVYNDRGLAPLLVEKVPGCFSLSRNELLKGNVASWCSKR